MFRIPKKNHNTFKFSDFRFSTLSPGPWNVWMEIDVIIDTVNKISIWAMKKYGGKFRACYDKERINSDNFWSNIHHEYSINAIKL